MYALQFGICTYYNLVTDTTLSGADGMEDERKKDIEAITKMIINLNQKQVELLIAFIHKL